MTACEIYRTTSRKLSNELFLHPIHLTDQSAELPVEYKLDSYFKRNNVNTSENEAHGDMEQNRFLFFSRIHTKKYQFSFQGVHLKNNGNLKGGQFLKFKKQTCM